MAVKEEGKIIFCGVKGCCPTITFNTDDVLLTDDFGGKVKLTKNQWNELKKMFIQ